MTKETILSSTKYQRAIERADRDGVQIVGKVSDKNGQFLGWAVQGNNSACYLVRRAGGSLICSCKAAQQEQPRYCKHRARVCQRLMEDATEVAQAAHDAYDVAKDALVELYTSTDAERDASVIGRHDSRPTIFRGR